MLGRAWSGWQRDGQRKRRHKLRPMDCVINDHSVLCRWRHAWRRSSSIAFQRHESLFSISIWSQLDWRKSSNGRKSDMYTPTREDVDIFFYCRGGGEFKKNNKEMNRQGWIKLVSAPPLEIFLTSIFVFQRHCFTRKILFFSYVAK